MHPVITAFVCTHVGKVRRNNEDNFFMNGLCFDPAVEKKGFLRRREYEEPVQLYAVCDGMGGQDAGEEASKRAVALMGSLITDLRSGEETRAAVNRYAALANDAVAALKTDSGTTLVLLCIRGDTATIAWLGDSRAYLLRDGKLLRLTIDHTEEQRLIQLGLPATGGRARSELTRYLGMDVPGLVVTPSYSKDVFLRRRDAFLLCSDGLTNMIGEQRIAEILDASDYPARDLVDAALLAGGHDNATALVVDVERLAKPFSLFGLKT